MARLIGEAFLSSSIQVALERLASSDFIDYFLRGKLDDKLLKTLEITLNSINQVLDDAETKQYQSIYVKKWLDELKHNVYEADRLLDEIATDAPLKKMKAESQPSTSKVLGFFSAITNPFESRIKELLENLDFLAKQKDVLGLKEGTAASNEGAVSWKPSKRLPTTSLVDESSIYGRYDDKEEIIEFLRSDNDNGNMQVPIISIVGLGGMGKTTLAQLVYNDYRMQEQFELKAWVYVSESFDVVGLTKGILWSFQSSADGEDLNMLQRQLQQRLAGNKYLLVLDDVWNGNGESWERLLLPFNYGSSGSKIIVTTRDKEVAAVMKSTKLCHLQQLNETNCWSLFVRHAFYGKNVSEYPILESIGKKIVDKCGGLPLAVKTLGNLLRMKFSLREWVKIFETDLWCLSENDSNINPALRLSYHNLPSNLKRCFAYCSIFPKGYKFNKDRLIKLWMAEGLLKCCGIDKSEEELGDEFFNDLESISFLQRSKWYDDDENIVMHDLVNDLAKSVSGGLCLWIKADREQDIPQRTRHIWWSLDFEHGGLKEGDKTLEHIYKIKGLRSLNLMATELRGIDICNNVQRDLFSRLKYLRMLSFRFCNLYELADEIEDLKLLRYLDVSCTRITRLPDSICKVYNLQTLILTECPLTELPSDFYKLANLRHLDLDYTNIETMPKHIGRLNHLQKLTPGFFVGEHSGSDIKELAKLNHLQGPLRIVGLENVIDPADAAEANLKDRKYLEELCLMYGDSGEIEMHVLKVLEALQPNSNLNRLTIKDYSGSRFPNWLGDCHFSNLVSIHLVGSKFCSQLPPLGQLPSLEELYISDYDGLEIIGAEFYGNISSNVPFRSLKVLSFEFMSDWKEWLWLEGFPSLKELRVKDCPKLKRALPQHLPSLQILDIINCQELEALIPKAANISSPHLVRCENFLLNEMPSSLKSVSFRGTRVNESTLEQILLNYSFLESLVVDVFHGENQGSSNLILRSYDSLRALSISGWPSSSWSFALDLIPNLHSLELENCPELDSFPGEGLPSSLSILRIHKCPKLIASREEWGLFKLHSLETFDVSDDFENVQSFPEENLLPPSMYFLNFGSCSKLGTINYRGLLHLKSLKCLGIFDCPCLERLPEEGLPNSLAALGISGCPLLEQQYQEEKGERWHTICHIPFVRFW